MQRCRRSSWVRSCPLSQISTNTCAVDEKDLAKAISCVFQNALKFTESGRVELGVRFCEEHARIKINIKDSGPGIPHSFRARIFKPFAREDDSTTRQREGLGLGLLIAKGLSRKLGGDLVLVQGDTSGPHKGSVSRESHCFEVSS